MRVRESGVCARCVNNFITTTPTAKQAKWIGDGQWYEAVVQGVVENGYKVREG